MYELFSAISLALIAAFLYFPYNEFRVDRLRQEIFSLRDSLFDDATSGTIPFDSQAYRATRDLFNGAIRYSHRLSFSRLIATGLILGNTTAGHDAFLRALNSSPTADREVCKKYIDKLNVAVAKHLLTSPLFIVLILPAATILILTRVGVDLAGKFASRCGKAFAEFDRLAFREGQSERPLAH